MREKGDKRMIKNVQTINKNLLKGAVVKDFPKVNLHLKK